MRDVMCFKIGGKLMNKDEARKIGGFTMTEKLFKKQTGGLLYNRENLEKGEKNDKTIR